MNIIDKMKSLSPNAQEFIPLNNNNNNSNNANLTTPAVIMVMKDPHINSGFIQYNGIQSPDAGLANPLTISTKKPSPLSTASQNNNNLNQYSIYLNQTNISPSVLTTQTVSAPSQPPQSTTLMFNPIQTHIIASPIAGFHSPIQPILPPPPTQFPYNAQYAYSAGSHPVPTPSINQYQQYQINPYHIQQTYIDNANDQFIYQHQRPIFNYNSILVQQKYHQNKRQNNFNRLYNNNNIINHNNNLKQIKNSIKRYSKSQQPIIDNSNEKEWPSLTSDKVANVIKNQSDDEEVDHQENIVKEPYLKDENKLKKLLKNVNFIKTAVEQHYLNENNISKISKKEKLSFKEVIINSNPSKPKTSEIISNEVKENNSVSLQQETKTTKVKKSRKRSNSKKKLQNQNDEKLIEKVPNFDLKNEDFPNLSVATSSAITFDQLRNKDHKSDAYSSDGTLDPKSSSNPQLNEKATKKNTTPQQKTNSKKSSQPITLEFANMITALQKGQNNNSVNNQPALNKKNQISRVNKMPYNDIASKKGLSISNVLVNPLDPTSIIKRGKEREKPKIKKHSTLKKIIIKEREEKRRLKEQSHKMDNLSLNIVVDSLTDLPLENDILLSSPLDNINSFVNNNLNVLIDNVKSPNKSHSNSDSTDKNSGNQDKNEFSSSTNDSNINEPNEEDNESHSREENNSIKEISSENENQDEKKFENEDDSEKEEGEEEEEEEKEEEENCEVLSNQMSPISQGSPISFGGYSPSPYSALNVISNERNLISLDKLEEKVKQKIHSRKFREYCNQIINKDVDAICIALLQEIVRFQDRLYHKNPIKAKTKRRYVMGIREVTKHLKLQKLKCIVLAPNCEKIQSKGGLDDAINFIIQTSIEQNVPFVFALGRKGLGKAVNKLVPISVVGIFDYSGAEEYFKRLVELANNAKLAYQEIVEDYEKEECENLILMQSTSLKTDKTNDVLKSNTNNALFNTTNTSTTMPKIPSHMAHSRTPSTGSNISIEPFFMNYHTHSRSASGNFNYGHTTTIAPGHSRSASGSGGAVLNIDLTFNKNWATHSRTPSNCSNISFISRLSEPISEVGTLYLGGSNSSINHLNTNSTLAAVQFYNEQVRQEMSYNGNGGGGDSLSNSQKSHISDSTTSTTYQNLDEFNSTETTNVSNSLANLHLGSINENDAGNEADIECDNNNLVNSSNKTKRYLKKQSSSTETTEATEDDQINNEVLNN